MLFDNIKLETARYPGHLWAHHRQVFLANSSCFQDSRTGHIQTRCEVGDLKSLTPVLEALKKTRLVTCWYVSNPYSEGFQTDKVSTQACLPFLNFSPSGWFNCSVVRLHDIKHTFCCMSSRVNKRPQCAPDFHWQQVARYVGCKALLNALT